MKEMKLVITLLAMEVFDVGNNTLSKAAMAQGMSNYIYATYTHAISFVFLIPMAFLFHRKTPSQSLGYSTVLQLLLLGTINYACFICLFNGIRYSSPTLASALANLAPAFTFITAVIFRMETLNRNARSSVLKAGGTIISVTGAFILTFYKGLPITIFPSPTKPSLQSLFEIQLDWAIGALLLTASIIFISMSYIIKTWITRDYHSEVMITLISCFFETILAGIIAFFAENDASVWTPTNRLELFSILIGALAVTILNIVITWACRVKGPLYVAMFIPLQMIIAVVMGIFFLGEVLHVGSVFGGMIIALGFYTVMKGKGEDETPQVVDQNRCMYEAQEKTSSDKVPLLMKKTLDV